jgi:hypothetical protein
MAWIERRAGPLPGTPAIPGRHRRHRLRTLHKGVRRDPPQTGRGGVEQALETFLDPRRGHISLADWVALWEPSHMARRQDPDRRAGCDRTYAALQQLPVRGLQLEPALASSLALNTPLMIGCVATCTRNHGASGPASPYIPIDRPLLGACMGSRSPLAARYPRLGPR